VLDYGYSPEQIGIEFTVPHRVPNIYADIVVSERLAATERNLAVAWVTAISAENRFDAAYIAIP